MSTNTQGYSSAFKVLLVLLSHTRDFSSAFKVLSSVQEVIEQRKDSSITTGGLSIRTGKSTMYDLLKS
ncbi:hypothetical protein BHE90_011932 [Fusarium euwallaceae]|uniref:Uncharacterized protein n=1 Tax=Fusarium euwallaceae TaxID=1147111 RepID=A0A430LD52_9HYPO|nr:hypothetical protein BHE90_011932 [Fusarium euwallaceae]